MTFVSALPSCMDRFRNRITWDEIDRDFIQSHLHLCHGEDLGRKGTDKRCGDLTTESCRISGHGEARIVAREKMIVCGTRLIPMIASEFGATSVRACKEKEDGQELEPGDCVAILEGLQAEILMMERTVLNFMQRLSGVATCAHRFKRTLEPHGVGLLDTRKTTPGMRMLEKYASACGGSYNHRMGLYDRILIKDNHLAASSVDSPSKLERFVKDIRRNQPQVLLQVEVDEVDQIRPALEGGADAILLDNFSPEAIVKATEINLNQAVLEASGGINEQNLSLYAQAKPHFVSSGAPVHASRWLDLGLDWR
ncbi:MAG TPA: carboxylating nicotinate-nucleotide diphosphorylase [Opitutae bacterium]|nr:carboxylating nicotinate-nucleotide diphosphorylase [Opitutae bacterium]